MSINTDRLKRRLEGLSTPPMSSHRSIRTPKLAVGDRVRVQETAEAIAAGVGGLVGDVVGFATPPGADTSVIEAAGERHGVNVSFAEKDGIFWFAREHLEIIDDAASGGENAAGPDQGPFQDAPSKVAEPEAPAAKPRPWWKFGRG